MKYNTKYSTVQYYSMHIMMCGFVFLSLIFYMCSGSGSDVGGFLLIYLLILFYGVCPLFSFFPSRSLFLSLCFIHFDNCYFSLNFMNGCAPNETYFLARICMCVKYIINVNVCVFDHHFDITKASMLKLFSSLGAHKNKNHSVRKV